MSARRHGWQINGVLPATVIVAVLLALTGLVASRADVACLSLPLLGWAAWRWQHRPATAASDLTVELGSATDSSGSVPFHARVAAPREVQAVQLRYTMAGADAGSLLLDVRSGAEFHGRVPALHSGPVELLRLEYRLIAPDAAFVSDSSEQLRFERVVPPAFGPIETLPLPDRLTGPTGAHESSRPGDGGEFRDIHPFVPGDRLRRIDWKATARLARAPGDLFVRRSAALSDVTVSLVIDSSDDVGEVIAEWPTGAPSRSGRTSLDLARAAASSIAAGYVRAGDQVAFHDLAAGARAIPAGSGQRHLQRVLAGIAAVRATGSSWVRRRPPVIASRSLVFVISTFLDDEAGRLASLWRASGHRVIAVDVLPAADPARLTREQAAAHRLLMAERDEHLRRLTAAGVEVLRWAGDDGPGSPSARLRSLTRVRRQ
jgi:uncharacterized protein (DUF58 family)